MINSRILQVVVFTGVFFMSLASRGTRPGNTRNTAADSTYVGPASFAYTIGSRKVDIKSSLETGKGKFLMVLFSNEVSHDETSGMVTINVTNLLTNEVFKLLVADKGQTNIKKYSPTVFNFNNAKSAKATYMSPESKNYYGLGVTVTVTAADPKRITGTFSGQFKDDEGKILTISDGRFDLPLTASR